MALKTLTRRERIKNKIRSQISGTSERPRVSIFRSNKYIYAQAIDDKNGKTIAPDQRCPLQPPESSIDRPQAKF